MDVDKINHRLDCVQDLIKHPTNVQNFRERLAKHIQKLREFKVLLQNFKSLVNVLHPLRVIKDQFQSSRLKRLVTMTTEEEDGMLPDMEEAIKELDYLVLWKTESGLGNSTTGEEDIPEPRRGIDEHFDEVNDKVTGVKAKIHEYLRSVKAVIRSRIAKNDTKRNLLSNIKYVHARYRYEIEIPNELCKEKFKPDDLVITS